jgi:type I restriction enzyme M protein
VENDIEKRLWSVADQLWANTGLRPSDFSAPVLGLIFLRYAEHKYADAESRIGPLGSGNRRKVSKADYIAEGVIFLPPEARFSYLQRLLEGEDVGRAINDAMKAIETENTDLSGAYRHVYDAYYGGNESLYEDA